MNKMKQKPVVNQNETLTTQAPTDADYQSLINAFNDTLAKSKSVFVRVPGSPGYDGKEIEAGIIAEDLEKDPLGKYLIETTEDGGKGVNIPKTISALAASLGDLHEKINVLANLKMSGK